MFTYTLLVVFRNYDKMRVVFNSDQPIADLSLLTAMQLNDMASYFVMQCHETQAKEFCCLVPNLSVDVNYINMLLNQCKGDGNITTVDTTR